MTYNKDWTATCPKCSHVQASRDFTCSNCGKGPVKASEYNVHGTRSVYLGCSHCDEMQSSATNCQKCGASINEKFITTPGGCFIATATYGDYDHPRVKELRILRDNFLVKSGSGRSFIKAYYRFSPKIAEVIVRHRSLRIASAIVLTPLAYIIGFLDRWK